MKSLTVLSTLVSVCFTLSAQTVATHDAVDLGLSVKWATCNVGASQPEEAGNYYAWGEIAPKQSYTWRTYKHCEGSSTSLFKYCVGNSYGKSDNRVVLESVDDVATTEWGKAWRMPTDAEMTELLEKCTWTWGNLHGVCGYMVASSNGKSIFLPAVGSCQAEEKIFVGAQGIYATSTSCRDYSFSAYSICFDEEKAERVDISRRFGISVRPVRK